MQSWVMEWRRPTGRLRRSARVLALIGGLVMSLLVAASADAATSYRPVDSFGTAGSGAGEVTSSDRGTGIAVDGDTIHVFVVDGDHVNVYDANGGGTPTYLTAITGLTTPQGIAIDPTSGALYVADAGVNQIRRYTSDGAPVPTFTQDVTYFGPSFGSGPADVGNFSSPIAIDPRNGDLVVADLGNLRVSRYSSGGASLGAFDGAGTTSGAFHRFLGVAVDDAGDVYVVDDLQGFFPFPGSTTVVERFHADGTPLGRLTGVDESVRSVAFDPTNDNVVVAGRASFGAGAPALLHVFDGETFIESVEYPVATQGADPLGLAFDEATGRLYALTHVQFGAGIASVQVFAPVILPDVAIQDPTDVTATAATLRATVDPLGEPTTVYFEYAIDGEPYAATAPQPVAAAGSVEAQVELAPNRAYVVRAVAENANGARRTQVLRFRTLSAPPEVRTTGATDRSADGATLRGTINPFGLQATYHFEYGATTAYGQRVPMTYEQAAGNGHERRAVSHGITGLTPGATYHYRLVATSDAGTSYGPDRTFTTRLPGAVRAYERVSPADKGGSTVQPRLVFRASPDGDRVAYRWRAAPSGASAAPRFPQSVAHRGPESWASFSLDPPQLNKLPSEGVLVAAANSTSRDLTRAVVVSRKALAPGAIEGRSNFYLRDTTSGAYATLASTTTEGPLYGGHVNTSPVVAGTADFDHVLLGGSTFQRKLLPDAPDGALYEWKNGRLSVASVAPDGTALGAVQQSWPYQVQTRETPFMSADGSRVAFNVSGGPAYVRIDGSTTVPVSASQQTGDAGTEKPADIVGITPSGGSVFVFSQDLTDDSIPGARYLYRFDVPSRQLTRLAQVDATAFDLLQSRVTESAITVYFTSGSLLTPDAVPGQTNVYVSRNGTTKLVAGLDPVAEGFRPTPQQWMASPEGRYFVFVAYTRLGDYDNRTTAACNEPDFDPVGVDACAQAYRYDADTGETVCVSCRPDERGPTGNAYVGPVTPPTEGDAHYPDAVFDDGAVVFDTTEPLAADDRNSSRDVYLYEDGDWSLISGGAGAGDTELAEVTPDRRSVFFTTEDRLVATDDDQLTDLYVARLGGGLSAQHPESPQPRCVGEDCRGNASGVVSTPGPASQVPSAGPNGATVRPVKPAVRAGRAAFVGTTLRLTVDVSGSGRIRVTGAKVATTTRTAVKAGSYELRVPLRAKYRKLRRAGRRVRVPFTVKFTPAFGRSVSAKLTRTAAR